MVMVELSPEHEEMLRAQQVTVRERLLGELGMAESKGLPTSVVMADSIEKFFTGEAIPESGNVDEYLDAASDAPAPIEYERRRFAHSRADPMAQPTSAAGMSKSRCRKFCPSPRGRISGTRCSRTSPWPA